MNTSIRLDTKALVDTIKSRGYWRVLFRPVDFDATRISPLSKCEELVHKASVSLRGWDYPHIPKRDGTTAGSDYVQGATDSGAFKELWRLYQSGQFVHLDSLKEDWMKEDSWFNRQAFEPGEVLGIVNTVYTITEIFEFLARLARFGIYREGVDVIVKLHNTQGRKLHMFDPMRGPLFGDYRSQISDISFERRLTDRIAIERPQDTALESILQFFYCFDWKNPPVDVIKADQQKLLEKKL